MVCSVLGRKATVAFRNRVGINAAISPTKNADMDAIRKRMLALVGRMSLTDFARVSLPLTRTRKDAAIRSSSELPSGVAYDRVLPKALGHAILTGSTNSHSVERSVPLPKFGSSVASVTPESLRKNVTALQAAPILAVTSLSNNINSQILKRSRSTETVQPVRVAAPSPAMVLLSRQDVTPRDGLPPVQSNFSRLAKLNMFARKIQLLVSSDVSNKGGLSASNKAYMPRADRLLNHQDASRSLSLGTSAQTVNASASLAPSARAAQKTINLSSSFNKALQVTLGSVLDLNNAASLPAQVSTQGDRVLGSSPTVRFESATRSKTQELRSLLQRSAVPPTAQQHSATWSNRALNDVERDFRSMDRQSTEDRRAKQQSSPEAAMVVNLTGDVVIDGRRLGRITASSQAREASLPARGPSRINLRAMPMYSGTQLPA